MIYGIRKLGRIALICTGLMASTGCVSTKATFEADREASDPAPEELTPSQPVRLLIDPQEGDFRHVHTSIMEAMGEDPRYERVTPNSSYLKPKRHEYDFRAALHVKVEGAGEAINFLTCFPGFVLFMPQWYPLRWACVVSTEGKVQRMADGKIYRFARQDAIEMAYTSTAYSVAAHTGWWSLVFTPMGAFPLGAGIFAVFDSADMEVFNEHFPDSPSGRQWARSISQQVLTTIAESERELQTQD